MFNLKNHLFGVEAFFDSSLVLTYAVPKDSVTAILPPCLKPDTYNNEWAFVAMALVSTKHLRPKGFPAFMGNSFFLIGYRIFVQYINKEGRRLRGLYILKSETDKNSMGLLGNVFTHYKYTTTDIDFNRTKDSIRVISQKSNLDVEVHFGSEEISLPVASPFKDWKEARRFAGPLPFTFTYLPQTQDVLIVQGMRESWIPKPVEVIKAKVGFVESMSLKDMVLANAFVVENIPYYWKKGVVEKWNA